MKEFSNASFQPDIIKIMTLAMNGALSTLPHPVSSTQTQAVAETILRTAKDGERDAKVLERMALLELQIAPDFSLQSFEHRRERRRRRHTGEEPRDRNSP
jgi:hypothetical protein